MHVISVEVMRLVQALPENQLATMLTQHRFSDAEIYAVEYNIDPQVRRFLLVAKLHPLPLPPFLLSRWCTRARPAS